MDRLTNPQNFDADLEMAILEGLTEILEDEEDVPCEVDITLTDDLEVR